MLQWEEIVWKDEDSAVVSTEAQEDLLVDHEKCTRQFVLNARRNVKFHSSLKKTDQSIAESALLRKALREINNSL